MDGSKSITKNNKHLLFVTNFVDGIALGFFSGIIELLINKINFYINIFIKKNADVRKIGAGYTLSGHLGGG